MNDGYIKLHRSILQWEWWDDPNTTRVFIWLLLNAQWEDSRYHGYDVPRGSLVTSYASIAKNTKISVKAARVAINHLKMTGEVALKGQAHFSIVTIVNWDKFQGYEEEEGKHQGNHLGSLGASKGQAKGNIKEIKNIRIEEDKKEEEILRLYNSVCYLLKPCSVLTKTRLEKVKLLLEKFSLDDIKSVFEKANKSDFLLGKNDRGWKATFDWLIDIDNFVKVQEDNFANSVIKSGVDMYRQYKKGNYDFAQLEFEAKHRFLEDDENG